MTSNVSLPVAFVHCPIMSSLFSVPPYGQDDLGDLRSVFEIPHLREHAIFLNTQCMFCCVSPFQTTDHRPAFRPHARAFRAIYFQPGLRPTVAYGSPNQVLKLLAFHRLQERQGDEKRAQFCGKFIASCTHVISD